MDTTTLNEIKAHLTETDQGGKRVFAVTIPGLKICFTRKGDAKEFKRLYDVATKHIS